MAGGFRIGKRARNVNVVVEKTLGRGSLGRLRAVWRIRVHFPRLEERVCPCTELFSTDLALCLPDFGRRLCSLCRMGAWDVAWVSDFRVGSWLRRLAVMEGSGLDTAAPRGFPV
jgi:hypothetical protein